MMVPDATSEFFARIDGRTHQPLLGRAAGRVRFELVGDGEIDSWLVGVRDGGIVVSRGGGDADCVVRARKALFDGIARGEVNAMAAMLRGDLVAEGDLSILLIVQRLFPGPGGCRHGPRNAPEEGARGG